MFLTGLPFINLTMNGVDAAVAPVLRGAAHLTVFAPHGAGEEEYYAFSENHLPKEDDQSDFAKLYRVLQSVVAEEKIRGPYGEDHPAVYYRFEYPPSAAELTMRALLEALVAAGITLVVTRVSCTRENHAPIRMKIPEYEAHVTSLKEQVLAMVGPWMNDQTEFVLPKRVDVEAQERELEEWREKQRNLPPPGLGERILDGVTSAMFVGPVKLMELWGRWRYRKK